MIDKGRSAIRSPCRRHAVEPSPPKSFAAGTVQGYWEMEIAKFKAHVQVFLALSGLNGRHAKGLEVGE